MKALLMTGYGPIADNLRIRDVPPPRVGDGDVLIDVYAASINPIDFKMVQGKLRRIQKHAFPAPVGFDASGVIIGRGKGATRFFIGDEVYVRADRNRTGTFAEQVSLEERWVSAKPATMTHEDAASIPLVGLTTVQGLKDRAQAQPGQRILIHAGSGGVGTFAIQYAKALGLRVTTTTSSRNADWVAALGADEVIAYDKEDYKTLGRVFDIVYDTLGGQFTMDAFDLVRPGGAVVSIAGVPDRDFAKQVKAGFAKGLAMRMMSRKVLARAERAGARYFRFLTESDGAQLSDIGRLIDEGRIRAVIDSTYPFENIIAAMQHAAEGRAKGKVIVRMKK